MPPMWKTDYKNESKRGAKKGFSLIELIIVTALIAVVSLTIYSALNNGIRLWQRINNQAPEEDLNIFFDKFSLDLRNALKFDNIAFLGQTNRLEFATLVNSPRLNKRTVGKVVYSYNFQKKALEREQRDFAQVYSGEAASIVQSLEGVRFLKFKYYFYDGQTKEYLWQDDWPGEGLPVAVRIELGVGNGAKIGIFTKTVSIMVSG